MEVAGFEDIRVYILQRQNTVTQYISMRPILGICERRVQKPGGWVALRW